MGITLLLVIHARALARERNPEESTNILFKKKFIGFYNLFIINFI
jgi:hypothetical protein